MSGLRHNPLQIIKNIGIYERERGEHASGTFGPNVLEKIVEYAPPSIGLSVETGCGKSSILLSNLSASHVVFTVDDSQQPMSSLIFAQQCPLLKSETVTFVLGPSQRMLPFYEFLSGIDLALIDGPHAYPFPDLEFNFLYPRLRPGALLIVDDLHIPSIFRMYEIISEDYMFHPLHIEDHTAFLRRTDAPTFCASADGWDQQAYNAKRFPHLGHVER